jgi:hypothetical protein
MIIMRRHRDKAMSVFFKDVLFRLKDVLKANLLPSADDVRHFCADMLKLSWIAIDEFCLFDHIVVLVTI